MKKTLLISVGFSILFVMLNTFLFWGDWFWGDWHFILYYGLLPGFCLAYIQKYETSLQIIKPTLIGSIIWSFLGMLLVVFISVLKSGTPFDWQAILQGGLIYAIISFIGGLVEIVIKGFIALAKRV